MARTRERVSVSWDLRTGESCTAEELRAALERVPANWVVRVSRNMVANGHDRMAIVIRPPTDPDDEEG